MVGILSVLPNVACMSVLNLLILAPRRVKGEKSHSILIDRPGILVYQPLVFALWLTYGTRGISQSVTVIPS